MHIYKIVHFSVACQRETETDRQTEIENRETRQGDRQTHRQTETEKGETDKTERQTDRQRGSTEPISFLKTIRSPNVASHDDYRTKGCSTAMIILNSLRGLLWGILHSSKIRNPLKQNEAREAGKKEK